MMSENWRLLALRASQVAAEELNDEEDAPQGQYFKFPTLLGDGDEAVFDLGPIDLLRNTNLSKPEDQKLSPKPMNGAVMWVTIPVRPPKASRINEIKLNIADAFEKYLRDSDGAGGSKDFLERLFLLQLTLAEAISGESYGK